MEEKKIVIIPLPSLIKKKSFVHSFSLSLSLAVLYKISIGCVCFLFQY